MHEKKRRIDDCEQEAFGESEYFHIFFLKKSNYNLVPWCFHPLKFGNLEKQLMGTILQKEDLADDFRSKIGDLEQELEVKRNQMCV